MKGAQKCSRLKVSTTGHLLRCFPPLPARLCPRTIPEYITASYVHISLQHRCHVPVSEMRAMTPQGVAGRWWSWDSRTPLPGLPSSVTLEPNGLMSEQKRRPLILPADPRSMWKGILVLILSFGSTFVSCCIPHI